MTVAPANTSSIIVAVTGVLQDPSTYSVSGTTLTFSAAPPSGTSNISVRYLGIPASGVTTTAYRTVTNTTATAGQTSFTIPSYTVGYVDVYRNGVYLPTSDYTATTGTTVVLNNACTVGDTITTISFYVSSVLNAIPATAASINSSYLASGVARANWGAGGVLQVVNATYATAQTTTSTSYQASGLAVSITPSSSTSKILITGNVPYDVYGGSGNQASLTMYRGATNLMTNGFAIIASGSSNELQAGSMAVNWLDSPATTSATTYTIYFRANSGGGTARIFVDNYTGSLTAMEIAA
jgi:hypothetical protein